MRSLNIFNIPNPSGRTRPRGLLSLQQKLVLEDIYLGKEVPASQADNLTAICEQTQTNSVA
jgi:hypothetical protein